MSDIMGRLRGAANVVLGPAERLDTLMGTVVSQRVYGKNRHKAADVALAELQRLEQKLSVFIPRSEISRVNASAGVEPVSISEETLQILELSQDISEMSGGAFDITVGPLAQLWAVTSSSPCVPSAEAIKLRRDLSGFRNVLLDSERHTCYLSKKGQSIDLGGIAKGYAADRVIEVYRRHGVRSALADLGGNVAILGARPDGEPFAVGIQDPNRERGSLLGTLRISDTSVVTSGAYERGFWADGKWYHHIIDPRTGYPAESDIASVTIVAKQSVLADALATAIFVLGSAQGIALLSRYGRGSGATSKTVPVEAVIVKLDGTILLTDGLKPHFVPES